MENDNKFDISDYGQYFEQNEEKDSAYLSNDESSKVKEEIKESPLESKTSEPTQYSEILQEINVHVSNLETISISILIALGIVCGILLAKILQDKFWR